MSRQVPLLDVLLRVVPNSASVRHEERHRGANCERTREQTSEHGGTKEEADRDGCDDCDHARNDHFFQSRTRRDVDDVRRLRFSFALAQARDFAELATDLDDDLLCCTPDCRHRRSSDEEWQNRAEKNSDEDASRSELE